jgi:hemerythrin superfamily protein
MPNAIDLLIADHRTVDALFEKVAGTTSPDKDTVDQIVKELSIHDAIERSHLYPRVRHNLDKGATLADHSEHEHDEVAQTLVAIDHADAGSAEQAAHLKTLIEAVRRHVNEEETQIFPALRKDASADDLDKLGEILASAKKTAPTRPHPHAPSEGVGTKVAGAMSAPLDKIRDAVEGR